jgi:hypothetical protein
MCRVGPGQSNLDLLAAGIGLRVCHSVAAEQSLGARAFRSVAGAASVSTLRVLAPRQT